MIMIDGQKFIALVAGFVLCSALTENSQKFFSVGHLFRQQCGFRAVGRSGRIVGGQDAYHGKWPWHLCGKKFPIHATAPTPPDREHHLLWNGFCDHQKVEKEKVWVRELTENRTLGLGMCGGALISSKHILTAAHCQPEYPSSILIVVLGEHDISGVESHLTPVLRFVEKITVHPEFNTTTYDNDLAILETQPVILQPHIAPICLPYRHEDFSGEMAFVTGWGRLTYGGDESFILQEVQVPIVTNEECKRMFLKAGYHAVLGKHFVCAGYSDGGRDSCQGDSGGPLMVRRDGRWVLVGVVSHGIGCGEPNLPTIYTRMSTFRPWVDSHTRVKLINDILMKKRIG